MDSEPRSAIRCHQETTKRHGHVHRDQLSKDLMAPFRTTTESHKHKTATNFSGKGVGKLHDPICVDPDKFQLPQRWQTLLSEVLESMAAVRIISLSDSDDDKG